MCLFFKHIDHDGLWLKMLVFLKRTKIFFIPSPLVLLQKIRASRHIKIKLLLKILLPYVVIIPL